MHLRSGPISRLRENQNKENEICFAMKCVSAVVKICSRTFKWLLLILILLGNKHFHKYHILVIYSKFLRFELILKKCFTDIFL